MAARKQVLEPGHAKRTRGASRKLAYSKVRARLLEALQYGANLEAACKAAGVTARQVRYLASTSEKFRTQYKAATAQGVVFRTMPPETLKRFLAACKWLCGIDVAREAVGLTKRELMAIFETRPDIKAAALEAQAEGRQLRIMPDGEAMTPQEWGRAKLERLVREALAMIELS